MIDLLGRKQCAYGREVRKHKADGCTNAQFTGVVVVNCKALEENGRRRNTYPSTLFPRIMPSVMCGSEITQLVPLSLVHVMYL